MIESDLLTSQIIEIDSAGYHVERVFVTDSTVGSKEARLYNVSQLSGIPQFNDPHPVIPEIFVSNVRVEPLKSGEQFKITVNYDPLTTEEGQTEETGGTGAVSISSGTVVDRTYKDINGELLFVNYTSVSGLTVTVREAIRAVDVQRPQTSVTLKRTESEIPKDQLQSYVGLVNSIEWSGFPEKTWLCTGINVSQNKDQWDVEYQFSYNKNTWAAEININVDNVVPIDVSLGNGLAIYDVYESINFNELGLSF